MHDIGKSANSGALISVVDAFVTDVACRELLAAAGQGVWIRSEVEGPFDIAHGSGRRSESLVLPAGFSQRATKWLRKIEGELANRLCVNPDCLEPWQMIRYHRGGCYDYQLNCGAWKWHPSGERARTFMLILEQPKRGGATNFRALAQTIRPLAGRLAV